MSVFSQYIYKGPDRACLSMHLCHPPDNDDSHSEPTERDETHSYIDAHYVSASEAFARIMGWPTHRVCFLSSLPNVNLI